MHKRRHIRKVRLKGISPGRFDVCKCIIFESEGTDAHLCTGLEGVGLEMVPPLPFGCWSDFESFSDVLEDRLWTVG